MSADARTAVVLVGTADEPRVTSTLEALGIRSTVAIDADLVAPGPRRVIVVDPALLGPDAEGVIDTLVAQSGSAPAVFLSGPCGRSVLSSLIARPTMQAVVARDHVTSDEELRHALRTVAKGPTFGWEGLLAPGAVELTRPIRHSDDRDPCLDEVADFLSESRVRGRIVRLVQDVADELITNAVYDAPTGADGTPLFATTNRRQAVELPPGGMAILRVARDPSHVAISMTDSYGSLSADTVRYYMAKGLGRGDDQVDDKLGGAGLGLTRIYETVDRMTVKVHRGATTEVMALIEIGGARRDMASRPPGLVLTAV